MKRLNRKGFTLIELLAIIVILAIIMVITIPTVLSSINNAKTSAFNTSAQTVADWFEKQYGLATVGDSLGDNADASYNTFITNNSTFLCSTCPSEPTVSVVNLLKIAGADGNNYSAATGYINTSTGRACIKLVSSANGKFGTQSEAAKSSGC